MSVLKSPNVIMECPSRDENDQTINMSGVGNEDSSLEQAIKGAIDSLETFDETQREQTYYKNIVKDSFSAILRRKCNVIQEFTLENHLAGLAMRIKKLPLAGATSANIETKSTFNANLINSNPPKANDFKSQNTMGSLKSQDTKKGTIVDKDKNKKLERHKTDTM